MIKVVGGKDNHLPLEMNLDFQILKSDLNIQYHLVRITACYSNVL